MCWGERGVHVPDGMSRDMILAIAGIVQRDVDVDRYLANMIARDVISWLQANALLSTETAS